MAPEAVREVKGGAPMEKRTVSGAAGKLVRRALMRVQRGRRPGRHLARKPAS